MSFKDPNWCDKHNTAHTGFTTLYCPKCEAEKNTPVAFQSGDFSHRDFDKHIRAEPCPSKWYQGCASTVMSGEVISWYPGAFAGRQKINGIIKLRDGEHKFRILDKNLVDSFLQFARGKNKVNAEMEGLLYKATGKDVVLIVAKIILIP